MVARTVTTRAVTIVVALVVTLLLGGSAAARPAVRPAALVAVAATPGTPTTVLPVDDPAALAVATSAVLLTTAPVAVLAAAADPAAITAAAQQAERLRAPLLLTRADGDPAGVAAELTRLGAGTVLAIDPAAARWAGTVGRLRVVTSPDRLPAVTGPPARPDVLVLTGDDTAGQLAAATTARASGARTVRVPGADPRIGAPPDAAGHVVALGSAFGTADVLAARLVTARSGMQLPGGGQVLFPGRRMVALYGHPGAPALGVLGEQDLAGSVRRAQDLAAQYQPLVQEPVVPAFELITTVADAAPGADGDYSAEASVADIRPWVDAAATAGVYVVLDLQPGRADFLSQAKLYAELLALPNVGLALDPEWRLGPAQTHRVQIGSVGIDEINAVAAWLATLTREKGLPQKLLMLHQFRTSMIVGRERLDTSHDELSVVIHADGFGAPGVKLATWDALHVDPPANIRWGWKNFYDEDTPMFTPAQTYAVGPTSPVFVSFQ